MSGRDWLGLVLLLPFVIGCTGVAETGKGIVRFSDGEVVESGSIELRSVVTGARYASRIDSSGRFHLADKDGTLGLPEGEYEAVVVQIVLTEDLSADLHTHGRTVPRRYADYYTSNLKVTTTDNHANPLELVLDAE